MMRSSSTRSPATKLLQGVYPEGSTIEIDVEESLGGDERLIFRSVDTAAALQATLV